MRITLKALGGMKEFFPDKREILEVETENGEKISDILKENGINPDIVMLVMLDGKNVGKDYIPKDNEEVGLLPPLAGG